MECSDRNNDVQEMNENCVLPHNSQDEKSESHPVDVVSPVTLKQEVDSEDEESDGSAENLWPVAVVLEVESESEEDNSRAGEEELPVPVKQEVELPVPGHRNDEAANGGSGIQFLLRSPQNKQQLFERVVVYEENPDAAQPQQNRKLELKACCVVMEKLPVLVHNASWTIDHNSIRNTGTNLFECFVCKKVMLKHQSLLERHMRIHNGEKPFECPQCDRTFRDKNALKKHSWNHADEKPYKCATCAKSFTCESNLTIHVRSHTGERPYKCHVCEKAFARESQVELHIRVHTGEKPYQCQVCSKSFAQLGNLNAHSRIHSDEMPYKCQSCDKRFKYNYEFKKHLLMHTELNPFKCLLCECAFNDKSILKSHVKIHGNEKPFHVPGVRETVSL